MSIIAINLDDYNNKQIGSRIECFTTELSHNKYMNDKNNTNVYDGKCSTYTGL
jgi:hypothetical protein